MTSLFTNWLLINGQKKHLCSAILPLTKLNIYQWTTLLITGSIFVMYRRPIRGYLYSFKVVVCFCLLATVAKQMVANAEYESADEIHVKISYLNIRNLKSGHQ